MTRTHHGKKAKRGDPRARVAHAHTETNPGKIAKLEALYAVWATYVDECLGAMVALKVTTVDTRNAEAMHGTFGPSTMSNQLQKCARQQAIGIMESWANGLYERTLRAHIAKGGYTADERRQLYTIGKYMLHEPSGGEQPIEHRLVGLYWSWVWDKNVTGKRPSFGNSGMMLGEMCVVHGPAGDATGLGDWWVSVSCLAVGDRVKVPLATHPSLDGKTTLAKSVLVGKRRDGRWTFQFTEYVPAVPKPRSDAPVVAVDVGKRVLLVTSDDRHYGTRGVPQYDRLFVKIRETRRNRMRQGLPKNSPRLAAMEERITGMVRTCVRAAVNEVIHDYPGHAFAMEALDFLGVRGSRRFAYTEAARSFARKVPVAFLNPAYTSQTCPSCCHVSRRNRAAGQFRCEQCGRVSHADFVGARNLLGRSEDEQVSLETPVSGVRAILRARYIARRSAPRASRAGGRAPRSTTVVPDAHSRALGGTASNLLGMEVHE